jgi:YHS domain-containing protein
MQEPLCKNILEEQNKIKYVYTGTVLYCWEFVILKC